MNVYHFDPITGEYRGREEAHLDPLESRSGAPVYLLPAHATLIKPPDVGKNKIQVWQRNVWNILPDFRGTKFWNAEGEHRIENIGDIIPVNAALTPQPQDHVLVRGQWVKDVERVREKIWRRLEADMHQYIFVTHDYPQPTQIMLQAIYSDPDSSEAQRAACKAIFDWVKRYVLHYYYTKKAEIMSAKDPEAMTWDFNACDQWAPGYSLAKIIQM